LKSNVIEELGKVVNDLQTKLDKKTVLGKRGYDDFMNFGGELDGHDKRFVMFSENPKLHGYAPGSKYFGEWSEKTRKPNGRGVLIQSDGNVWIGVGIESSVK
jgi:hypothetical protein